MISAIKKYLSYYKRAKTIYSCHAPKIYEFAQQVVEQKRDIPMQSAIESLREQLKRDETVINFKEFGAGSTTVENSSQKSVATIAKSSLSRKAQCEQLHELVKLYKPKTILEMGTSLGISTAYIAAAHDTAKIITLEGDKQVAAIAKKNFQTLGLGNIEVNVGQFSDTLDGALRDLKAVDIAFIDGNHRYEPTVEYFHKILEYTHDDSILIFDDIYWSTEMEQAWEAIKNENRVTMTVDLFHMGIVYLSPSIKEKMHHVVIPYKLKPWKIGVFG